MCVNAYSVLCLRWMVVKKWNQLVALVWHVFSFTACVLCHCCTHCSLVWADSDICSRCYQPNEVKGSLTDLFVGSHVCLVIRLSSSIFPGSEQEDKKVVSSGLLSCYLSAQPWLVSSVFWCSTLVALFMWKWPYRSVFAASDPLLTTSKLSDKVPQNLMRLILVSCRWMQERAGVPVSFVLCSAVLAVVGWCEQNGVPFTDWIRGTT